MRLISLRQVMQSTCIVAALHVLAGACHAANQTLIRDARHQHQYLTAGSLQVHEALGQKISRERVGQQLRLMLLGKSPDTPRGCLLRRRVLICCTPCDAPCATVVPAQHKVMIRATTPQGLKCKMIKEGHHTHKERIILCQSKAMPKIA